MYFQFCSNIVLYYYCKTIFCGKGHLFSEERNWGFSRFVKRQVLGSLGKCVRGTLNNGACDATRINLIMRGFLYNGYPL